jgi:ATP-dependent protease ClpP protease subunit
MHMAQRIGRGWCLGIVAWLIALSVTPGVWADIVYLNNGTWIKGTILRETKDEVEIDGKTNTGIPFKGSVSMGQVSSILRDDKPKEEVAPATPAPSPSKEETKPAVTPTETKPEATPETAAPEADAKKEPAGDFLVVPMKGTFGEEISPKGVSLALEWAVKRKIKHVVFEFESGGGLVWAATAIRDLMKKHDDALTYHAVVKEALSASICIVFACDTISVLPEATMGAAVAFSVTDSGAVQVDEKMNSAFAADIASRAESLGHSGHLVRAMILTDYTLYAVQERGMWRFEHDKPQTEGKDAGGIKVETLAEGNRVVTLTSAEMVKYGVARLVRSMDDAEIGGRIGDAAWKGAGNAGESSMKTATSMSNALRKQIDNWADQVIASRVKMLEAIKDNDVDLAIRSVEDFMAQLRRIGGIRTRAKELMMLEYPAFASIDVAKESKDAEDNLFRLKALKRQR